MTDPGPVPDYSRSQAVLIGAWDYENLTPVPAAFNSLNRMERTLTGPLCQWPAKRVHTIGNPARKGDLPDTLMDVFEGAVDVALFYFVGHGQLHGDDLCLALRESPKAGGRRMTTGLAFAEVRAALRESLATVKIVILDCCFSGQATEAGHSLAGDTTDVAVMTVGTGAFTMAASGALNTAWFNTDRHTAAPQTYFTEYLLDVVERGMPDQPGGLALGPLFTATAEALARDRKPAPTRSVRHDADRFVFARNAAAGSATGSRPESTILRPPTSPAMSRLPEQRLDHTLALFEEINVARSIPGNARKARALIGIAQRVAATHLDSGAAAGLFSETIRTTLSITGSATRAEALIGIAEGVAAASSLNPGDAAQLFSEAISVAQSIVGGEQKERALTDITALRSRRK